MPSEKLSKQFDLKRKETPDVQTEAREKCADTIEEMWSEEPTLDEIAEETGNSRQHVKNTLSSHFHKVDKDKKQDSGSITICIPEGVDITVERAK